MMMEEEDYISAYEYEKNVNPHLAHVPFYEKDVNDCEYGIDTIDFSTIFNVPHKSTTPNLLASFITLETDDVIELNNNNPSCVEFNATSHMFYIIKGSCSIHMDNNADDETTVCTGDIMITPCFNSLRITNVSETEEEVLQIYYINDSPFGSLRFSVVVPAPLTTIIST